MAENVVPFIKWAGGKSQIMDKILSHFPKQMNNYIEPFLGGGSVLFALLECIENKIVIVKEKVYAYDINESLIWTYKNIQKHPKRVIKILKIIQTSFSSITGTEVNREATKLVEGKTSQESYYYYIRNKFNNLEQKKKNSPLGTALFIFINRTCFRGLYREGPYGINVPYGHYKNPVIFSDEHIWAVSKLISDVNFGCASFETSIATAKKGDFIYMDPPYVPERENSFVNYTKNGFNHNSLFELCVKLSEVRFVMNNANAKLVLDAFSDAKKYKIIILNGCKRRINSKKPQSKTTELLVVML